MLYLLRSAPKGPVASTGFHAFLFLVLLFGSAFFIAKRPDFVTEGIKVLPDLAKLIDAPTSGGGNPAAPPTEGRQQGNTMDPPPKPPDNPPPVRSETRVTPPPASRPVEPRRAPKEEILRHDPAPPKKPIKEPPREVVKPPAPPKNNSILSELKPVNRNNLEAERARAEAERSRVEAENRRLEQQARRQAQAEAEAFANAGSRLDRNFQRMGSDLRRGFADGTVVDVAGPGGAAFINYADYVREKYGAAWDVSDNLIDDDSTARVSVTIARNGNVIDSKLLKPSGNAALDRSVKRALDRVRFVAPFPENSRDAQRTFTINFNLKAKRLSG